MLTAVVILIFVLVVLIAYGFWASSPKPFVDKPCDVLICAAHSDDCVIMGAEYASWAIENGHQVQIVYLTCSAPAPDHEMAITRRQEAISAWSSLGVKESFLTFIDLPESQVGGSLASNTQNIEQASKEMETLITALPEGSALIIPAVGESHIDHQLMRTIALQTLRTSDRDDFIVYETPEYNNFFSLRHCAERSLRMIAHTTPLLKTAVAQYHGRSNFVQGSRGSAFGKQTTYLDKKIDLMEHFVSQDPALMREYFAYPTLYRRVSTETAPLDDGPPGLIAAFGGRCDGSFIALGVIFLAVVFLTANQFTGFLLSTLPTARILKSVTIGLSTLVAAAYIFRASKGSVNRETMLIVLTGAAGVFTGAM